MVRLSKSGPPRCELTTLPLSKHSLVSALHQEVSPSCTDGCSQAPVSRLDQDKGVRISVWFSWHFWHHRWLFTALFAMTSCDISYGCNWQRPGCCPVITLATLQIHIQLLLFFSETAQISYIYFSLKRYFALKLFAGRCDLWHGKVQCKTVLIQNVIMLS